MTRRIVVIALAAAAVFAAIMGAASVAQAPEPTSSPDSTPTVIATAPAESATPQVTATIPAETPTQTATEPPVETATQEPTADAPTPEASPEQTAASSPTQDAAGTATPGQSPTPAAPAKGVERKKTTKKTNTEEKVVKVEKCSTSTSSSECGGHKEEKASRGDHHEVKVPAPTLTTSTGAPAPTNPSYSVATVGPAPIGVPNFFIDKFRIPPFLLSIYQAAGMQYGVRWEVLAAINEIETDYGRNLNVSYAGAVGWMQFMPSTWKQYGVDANRDGAADPYNPVDAIFAAARYLRAAGGDKDLRRGIFAYNHADWYVDSVLMRARLIGGLPADFVGSLTGLTQGRFPVHAKAAYAGQVEQRDTKRRTKPGHNAAYVVEADQHRRGIDIYARRGAPVVAVNDGRIARIGHSKRLGRFIRLQDTYGNTYTYARLGSIPKTYPAPKPRKATRAQIAAELELPARDAKPTTAASATARIARRTRRAHRTHPRAARVKAPAVLPPEMPAKQRLFAHPSRPNALAAGGRKQLGRDDTTFAPSASAPIGLDPKDFVTRKLKRGSRVVAGTMLGRIGKVSPTQAPHVRFELRPAGRGAPRVDPKPILDGWKLLESTAIYRAKGKNPFFGDDSDRPSLGQILLMGKEALIEHVLANPRIDVYACGERDIRSGAIDRRVLATLEFLAASGLKPTVSSMKCGHGFFTASGNVSQHSSGNALDIAMVNGIPIIGHQGKGSITDLTIQRLLTLQGTMKPDQIISLMTFEGADNTLALGDHDDHIHVGWKPLYGTNSKAAKQVNAVLKPKQWIKLIDRLGEIDNPEVSLQPSKHALKVTKRASKAHLGE